MSNTCVNIRLWQYHLQVVAQGTIPAGFDVRVSWSRNGIHAPEHREPGWKRVEVYELFGVERLWRR